MALSAPQTPTMDPGGVRSHPELLFTITTGCRRRWGSPRRLSTATCKTLWLWRWEFLLRSQVRRWFDFEFWLLIEWYVYCDMKCKFLLVCLHNISFLKSKFNYYICCYWFANGFINKFHFWSRIIGLRDMWCWKQTSSLKFLPTDVSPNTSRLN